MSDGITRLCREHDMELRQYGSHFACPRGHTCDVDWYVKPANAVHPTPALPAPVVIEAATPRAAEPADEPKPRREATMPKTKVEHPHGAHQRYWAGCRCQRCRTAITEYLKTKKRDKAAAAGVEPPRKERKASQKRASKRAPALPARRAVDAVIVSPVNTDLSRMADRIATLAAQLSAAEAEFAQGVNGLLRGWKIVPAGEAAQ